MAGFHRFECDIMKTETKAIVASALVVALALTAISGVTYSWFSDSEDATINVTTGTIEVDAKWSDFTLRSANIDGEKTVHIGDRDTSFPYTSSKFSSAETASSGSTKISVTAFMNPGDSFEFTISDIVLKNTIKAVFNYGYEIKVVDGPETIPFVVKHTTTDPEFNVPNITYAGSDTAREFSDNTITVTLPMDCGNEYQGCSYQMEFYIVAVQSNSPDANITQSNSGAAVHDVTAGDNVVAVSPAEGVFDSATIQFNSGSSDGKIVVKTVDSTTEGITVSDGNAILAGVDVTTGGSEHALRGTNVRITFVIDGELSENSISIYHDGAEVTPSDLTVNSEDGKTTISFTTSDGFSAYYVAANYDAKVGSAYYESFDAAVSATDGTSDIKLLRDIEVSSTVLVNKKISIDLNGFDFTNNSGNAFYIYGGNLNVHGTGIISSPSSAVYIVGSNNQSDNKYSVLTIGENVSLISTGVSQQAIAIMPYYDSVLNKNTNYSYGVVVDVKGTLIGAQSVKTNGMIKNTDNAPSVTLSGATAIGGMYLAGYGDYVIKDCTLSGQIYMKGGSLEYVNNYIVIESEKYSADYIYCGNGKFGTNAAIMIDDCSGYAGFGSIVVGSGNIFEYTGPYTTECFDVMYNINPDADYSASDVEIYEGVTNTKTGSDFAYYVEGMFKFYSTQYSCKAYFTTLEAAEAYDVDTFVTENGLTGATNVSLSVVKAVSQNNS